ncbi:hypothetical protein B0O99DRAFT_654337 [Bisporella sp. PMI_857]|nr:hypothetical protein B0O99DRAFT_654337 [Bisporella sp. PMI_857]
MASNKASRGSLEIELDRRSVRSACSNGGNVHIDLDQLLSHFGSCVPAPCLRPLDPRRDFYADILVASNLNYYTISKIGKLRIEWVESLSLHLDLHERSSKLRLFAFPSFCALLCQQFEKQDTFLSKIVSTSEDILETPSTSVNHSVQYAYSYDFLIEVLCTYRLIFGQDQKSYTMFSSIPSLEVVDPLLKSLCGKSYNKQGFYSTFEVGEAKAQYTASADFPLLGQRLLDLQKYMNERNPSDLRTLWYDRRDVLRFYTFWAVFLVGGISILISTLSLALTAVQVIEVYNK